MQDAERKIANWGETLSPADDRASKELSMPPDAVTPSRLEPDQSAGPVQRPTLNDLQQSILEASQRAAAPKGYRKRFRSYCDFFRTS